jgi:hypothetical protein
MDKRIGILLLGCVIAVVGASGADAGEELFETSIRPVLAKNCYSCHTQTMLGGLRLDSKQAMLDGGKSGPALVPGKPDESLLIKVVRHEIDDLKMPMGGKLADEQIAVLAQWVEMGAPWPETPDTAVLPSGKEFVITPEQRSWWSFLDIQPTTTPQIKDKRVANYIDSYVLAKLKEKSIEANSLADKRTLIRRVSLNLTGLPPTPEEVTQFVNDKSKDSYETLIERLLASERYGERWGRHWLDVVRYGEDDLHGIAKNRLGFEPYPKAYVYRDWVIKAFNDDMPYDTFVKAQLAADLMSKTEWKDRPRGKYDDDNMWGRLQVTKWDGLKKEERRKIIPSGHIVDETLNKELLPGLGFQGAGPWYYDLGDAWVMRADERNDRVDVVTRGFLGLTVACARCHDHKYDPIAAKDYYSLAGVFFNSPYHEYPLVEQKTVEEWRAEDKLFKAQEKRIKEHLQLEGAQLGKRLAYQSKDYMMAAWKVTGEPQMELVKAAYESKLDVEILQRWIKFLAKPPKNYSYLTDWQALIAKDGDEEAALAEATKFQATLLAVMTEFEENKERNEKIEIKSWPLDDKPPIPMPNEFKTSFEKYFIVKETMEREPVNLFSDVFKFDIDAKPETAGYPGRTPGLLSFKGWGLESRLTGEAQRHLERLREDAKKLEEDRGEQYPFVMGVRDSDVLTELPLHKRGSPIDLGDPVERRFVQVLSPEDGPKPMTKGSGRLELAESIASHPLAARVIVNRVWKWHFGTGIVDTPSNFGRVGDPPSHPELLEYLTQRFIDGGMSIKKLNRDILMSHTYRRSSTKNEAAVATDPENRLYWRVSRQRLDAEQLRDSILQVTGMLDTEKVGGSSGEIDDVDFKRRAVYGRVSRFLLADFQRTFDFPNPSISASKRFITSVPLQRLYFMNSDFVYNAAERLAELTAGIPEEKKDNTEKGKEKAKEMIVQAPVAKEAKAEEVIMPSDEERVEMAYQLLYSRSPTAGELAAGIAFVTNEANQKKPEKASDKAAVAETTPPSIAPAGLMGKPEKPTEPMPRSMPAPVEEAATNDKKSDDKTKKPVTAWNLYARALLSSNEFLFVN